MNRFLMGVAVAPLLLASQAQAADTAIKWAPSTIAFGNILVGSTSASKSITVSLGTIATGTTTASIAAATGDFQGAAAATLNLLAGHPISSSFTFAPTTTGAASQNIAVSGKNTTTTSGTVVTTTSGTVALSGKGVAPVGVVTTTYAPAFVLVGTSNSFAVTAKNTGNGNLSGTTAKNASGQVLSNLNGSFGTLAGLVGGGNAISLADGANTSATYKFSPAVKGATVNGNIVTTLTNGSSGANAAFSVATAVNLTAVAPISNITTDTAALARYNSYGFTAANATTTGATGVTVKNTGNGDLASASLGVQRNLNGSFGSPTAAPFSGPISGGGFSLTDGTKTDVTYRFDPTERGLATSNIAGQFSNGSSDGKNTTFATSVTLSGTGVGPTYASAVGATNAAASANLAASNTNTPVANTGVTTIDFGKINSNVSETLYLDIGNTTTDANGGNALLTDLSLLSASLAGSPFFSIPAISAIVVQGGEYFAPITFTTGGVSGAFSAVLTFQTDASAGFGLAGDTFSYNLVGSAVPEISTWAMMLAGFVGLGFSGLGGNKNGRLKA